MKKLLMLGGSYSQIPAIKRAKEMGYYVITCDYLPENPGHKLSDKYVNISTTDKEAIFEYSKKEKIDGICAYASDPAAETAAYVVDKMHLSGASLRSTRILAEKDLFRTFQKENGFHCPRFIVLKKDNDSENDTVLRKSILEFPCIVKPVDSSGSKGVNKVNSSEELDSAIEEALKYTRAGRVIIEEYIPTPYNQIHGEGFVIDGELVFVHLGEQHFNKTVPIGTGCPCSIEQKLVDGAIDEVGRLIKCIGFELGAVNIEARIDETGKTTVIEIGPRSGGNYMPQLMEEATGFNEVEACILAAMGRKNEIKTDNTSDNFVFQYIIGSSKSGKFKELRFSKMMENRIKKAYLHKKQGDKLQDYRNSSDVVGVLLIKCESSDEMNEIVSNIYSHVEVVVEDE